MWSFGHRPTKISDWNVPLVVGFSARFRTGELGTFLFHTNPVRNAQACNTRDNVLGCYVLHGAI
jgi:hypothetical protein